MGGDDLPGCAGSWELQANVPTTSPRASGWKLPPPQVAPFGNFQGQVSRNLTQDEWDALTHDGTIQDLPEDAVISKHESRDMPMASPGISALRSNPVYIR